ncbi:hypothetical protein BHE90_017441 [Fusarium euwallaceae]|uniref:Uncharacterized protein n=1 Tax=Fusarium euwallaceae TaxID=1147111 RepID=A0A430KXV5_9HYPO|nr:hypothetical protein BHE90_017441 [Fusarium euwallaceae]
MYETKSRPDTCELCSDAEKKQRQSDKMNCDVERWQRDGTREATAERPCDEMLALMKVEYEERSSLPRLGHVHEASPAETNDAPGSKRVGANGDDGSPGQLREARGLWSIMTKSMDAK